MPQSAGSEDEPADLTLARLKAFVRPVQVRIAVPQPVYCSSLGIFRDIGRAVEKAASSGPSDRHSLGAAGPETAKRGPGGRRVQLSLSRVDALTERDVPIPGCSARCADLR